MIASPTDSLAYLTPDLPGVGGVIKQRPEDFLVEEQPLYEPSGEGEHLMLFIEKRELTTSEAVGRIVKAFRVGRADVGYAGLKDKHAVTRQHLTVRVTDADDTEVSLGRIEQYSADRLKILWHHRHGNKLRRGHLAANRFVIRIRNVEPTAVVRAKKSLDRMVAVGAPNYVGEQRFGYLQLNHELGRLLLLKKWPEFLDVMLGHSTGVDAIGTREGREAYDKRDYAAALDLWPRHLKHDRQALDKLRQGKPPEMAVLNISTDQREFLVSAYQSDVFNRVLDRRIRMGLFDRLVVGDLACKHDNRAVFAVDEAVAAEENGPAGRVPSLAVSPSGPMWGDSMTRPANEPLQWELDALRETGLTEADLTGGPHARAEGGRRPMRTIIQNADIEGGVDEFGPYIRLSFELGRGSFATSILREIMKVPPGIPEDEEQELHA
ncbi:MAG: tRNA pseudouridine(13) synthase TruD [Planctomycetes bacterium]|nr:tRNA pseudouridine(13) synthase TruD [Planctomycetota bacterium]